MRIDWSLSRENGSFEITDDELLDLETVEDVQGFIQASCEADFESTSVVCITPDYVMMDKIVQQWKALKANEKDQ